MIDFFRTKTLVRKGSRNGGGRMDGNPKRQAQRNKLHRVREKIPYRPTDGETVCRVAPTSGIHIVGYDFVL